MPKRILMTRAVADVVAAMEQATEANTHIPGMFKKGDMVIVTRKVGSAIGWVGTWNSSGCMDVTVGIIGVVIEDAGIQGFRCKVAGAEWYYPSCALRRTQPGDTVAPPPPAQKKKRVRVGPGPWDQAPCAHLRWHLMGFFRSALAIVKTEGGPTEVKVRCTKCGTEMTLQAK